MSGPRLLERKTSSMASVPQRGPKLPASSSSSSTISALRSASSVTKNNVSTSSESIPASASSSNLQGNDAQMYHRFLALGMPPSITLEDFVRIMTDPTKDGVPAVQPSRKQAKGARARGAGNSAQEVRDESCRKPNLMREALEFLSVHFVGRQEARKVRACISSARKEQNQIQSTRPQSRIKAPTKSKSDNDILVDPMAIAATTRETTYRSLNSAQREYSVESTRIRVLDKQQRDLTEQLKDKRRSELLLRVLEKRECVRIERLGLGSRERKGLGVLVLDLRKESTTAMREFQSILDESSTAALVNSKSPTQRIRVNTSAFKYTHTTTALANLHARHRRAVRRERGDGASTASVELEARLEGVLSRLGVQDGAGMEKMKRTLVSVAHRRAAVRARPVYSTALGLVPVDDARLEEMHDSNEEKRREVQEKVNRAVALGWLCEAYIDLLSTFRSDTAPALSDAVRGEGKRVEGYVDVLRQGILTAQASKNPQRGFAREVRDVVGTTQIAVWDEVREMFGKLAASERMLSVGSDNPGTRVNHNRSNDSDGRVDVGVDLDAARSAKVLERKTVKAEYGFRVAGEVRAMVSDMRKM